jgi:serine protease Do
MLMLKQLVIGGILAAGLVAGGLMVAPQQTTGVKTAIANPGAPDSFAPLVDKLMPAVVNISTTQKIKGPAMGGMPFMFQMPDDPALDPFRDFFEQYNRQQGDGSNGAPQLEQEVFSLGSGFIIDPAGYVVTNNHVVAEAEEIHVILHDDTKLEAKVVGRDEKTDLCLLKVESKKDLPFVQFGDSDTIRVGDWVLAIGNPFGLGGTVTAGIISARSRSINAGPFDDFLQTDAAINRGNSGGPMFNMSGEVIGINTAIFSPSGGNIGIGFAVPSAMAKPVLMQLKEFGRTYRGWLGVKIQDVSEEIAESVGLDKAQGALVLEITPDSPAIESDIKTGDVIIEFNGQPIKEMRNLPRLVAETKIGETVPVKIWRNGKIINTTVKVGELDEQTEAAEAGEEGGTQETPKDVATSEVAGLKVAPLTGPLRERFGIKGDTKGLVIIEVISGSEAYKQGLRPGDIVTRVNGVDVITADAFRAALEEAASEGRDNALVLVVREGTSLYITLPTKN